MPPVGSALAPNAVAGYHDGFYLATTDDAFRVAISGIVVAAWQLDREQIAADHDTSDNFLLPTARLQLHGHAFVTTDFSLSFDEGSEPTGTTGALRDAYLDRPLFGARLRVGRQKPMFAREWITPITELQLPERAITALWPFPAITADRELGVTLYGHDVTVAGSHGFEWALGAFEGAAPVAIIGPTDASPVVTARFGWSSDHANSYSESDFDGGPLRFAAAIAYAGDLAHGQTASMIHSGTADAVIKLYGLSLSGAAYVDSVRMGAALDRQTYWRSHAQLGFMVIPRKFELVARYAHVAIAEPTRQEALGGFNIFFAGHAEKWQVVAGKESGDGDTGDWVARIQTQLVF